MTLQMFIKEESCQVENGLSGSFPSELTIPP
jgi:hypothetical protein